MMLLFRTTWFRGVVVMGGALFCGTLSMFAYYLISSGGDRNSLFPPVQTLLPGEYEVTFDGEGGYAMYAEYIAVTDSGDFSADTIPTQLTVKVFDLQKGSYLQIENSRTKVSYETNKRAGISILDIDVPHPGRYRIEGCYDNGDTTPRLMYAFGPKAQQIGVVLYGGAAFLVGCVVGLILMLLVGLKLLRKLTNPGQIA